MFSIRLLVAAVEEIPVFRRDGVAAPAFERDAGLRDAAPFLFHLLALVVSECVEKVGEVAVAGIGQWNCSPRGIIPSASPSAASAGVRNKTCSDECPPSRTEAMA